MKLLFTLALAAFAHGAFFTAAAQSTPYGSCPERAEAYQRRYEAAHQSRDLVCYQKALERELAGTERYNCPQSAQYYQSLYQRSARAGDLVCYQQALERELK